MPRFVPDRTNTKVLPQPVSSCGGEVANKPPLFHFNTLLWEDDADDREKIKFIAFESHLSESVNGFP